MWTTLPAELKLAIADLVVDRHSLAYVDRATYAACVPALYRTIRLSSLSALQLYTESVPLPYARYIHHLDLSTESEKTVSEKTTLVSSFLQTCICLKSLTLRLDGSLHYSLRDTFSSSLPDLTTLSIINRADPTDRPLSERFVVSLCASLPSLTHLSLDNISRSKLHASPDEPFIPLVSNDHDIPPLPSMGSSLSLPSLLSIPTLKSLAIRATHLGDPRWDDEALDVKCRLESLDVGEYVDGDEEQARIWTERIVRAVGRSQDQKSTLVSLSLTSSFSTASPAPSLSKPSPSSSSSQRKLSLPSLRSLHLSPFFPYFSPSSPSDENPESDSDAFTSSLSNLAESPIERIEIQCYEDDLADVCEKVEKFVKVRETRQRSRQRQQGRRRVGRNATVPIIGQEDSSSSSSSDSNSTFFSHLRQIDVVSVRDSFVFPPSSSQDPIDPSAIEALHSLQRVCREARLASSVREARMALGSLEYLALDSGLDSVGANTVERVMVDGRVRAMTI